MPLFRRHDGDLVRGEPAMRRVMPYVMRTRNESVVFHDSVYRMPAALEWMKAYNRTHDRRATLFHLFTYACGQALHARPQLNRFVSGGRLYQRRGVQVAFLVKRELSDDGVGTTVKLEILREEPFPEFVARIQQVIEAARGPDRAVDKETVLVMRLPGPLVRALVASARVLDAWNLYPRLRRMPFVEGDRVVASEGLAIRWTFDERIHDAFYAARSLQIVKRIVEHPTRHLGAPEGNPAFVPGERSEAAVGAP